MYVHFCEFTFISALHDYSTIMHKTDPFWPTNSNEGLNNGFKAKMWDLIMVLRPKLREDRLSYYSAC